MANLSVLADDAVLNDRFFAGLDALAAAPLPRTLRCRQQEGYAFYALWMFIWVVGTRIYGQKRDSGEQLSAS